jgi:hypothetical protein
MVFPTPVGFLRAAFVNRRTTEKDMEIAIAEMKAVLVPSA